ncbi:MAG: hypothetical protein ACK2TU_07680, partial [Anaerolineales bacterium]
MASEVTHHHFRLVLPHTTCILPYNLYIRIGHVLLPAFSPAKQIQCTPENYSTDSNCCRLPG